MLVIVTVTLLYLVLFLFRRSGGSFCWVLGNNV